MSYSAFSCFEHSQYIYLCFLLVNLLTLFKNLILLFIAINSAE